MKTKTANPVLPAKSFSRTSLCAVLFLLLLCFAFSAGAQTNTPPKYTKRTFSLIPSEVDKVNGLAVGAWAENLKSDRDSLKINGITILANLVLPFIYIRGGGFTIRDIDSFEQYPLERAQKFNQADLNGLLLSAPGYLNTTSIVKGVSLSAFTFNSGEMHGFSVSGLTNCSFVVKGVSICGGYNSGNKVRGLQIGLLNRATSLRGFQIGLWNKNGRRALPFINWQFRE